jgi:hypothetical protein
LVYSLILKKDVACSSETWVDFQRTAHCYIPDDRTLQINGRLFWTRYWTTSFHKWQGISWVVYDVWASLEISLHWVIVRPHKEVL